MFAGWGFLLGEIWILLLLAALLGLLAGWLIWGGAKSTGQGTSEVAAALEACRRSGAEKDAEIARLRDALEAAKAAQAKGAEPLAPAPPPVAVAPLADAVGIKPQGLAAARGGQADDLKRIKGIGPKLERLCHSLGYYHFDQIAEWSADEVAWVDENLEGFKGRVTRDAWVAQAASLASGGGDTDFD